MQTRRSKRKATRKATPEAAQDEQPQPTSLTASALSAETPIAQPITLPKSSEATHTELPAPHLHRHALVQKLYDLTSCLPDTIPIAGETDVLACFKDDPCNAILPGEDPWETHIDPQLNRVIGFGKTPQEIALFIRRGRLGMDGFCAWIEICVSDLNIQPHMLELRLERVFEAMKLLNVTDNDNPDDATIIMSDSPSDTGQHIGPDGRKALRRENAVTEEHFLNTSTARDPRMQNAHHRNKAPATASRRIPHSTVLTNDNTRKVEQPMRAAHDGDHGLVKASSQQPLYPSKPAPNDGDTSRQPPQTTRDRGCLPDNISPPRLFQSLNSKNHGNDQPEQLAQAAHGPDHRLPNFSSRLISHQSNSTSDDHDANVSEHSAKTWGKIFSHDEDFSSHNPSRVTNNDEGTDQDSPKASHPADDVEDTFSNSGSNYSADRRSELAKRNLRARKGHAVADTESEDEQIDIALASDVVMDEIPTPDVSKHSKLHRPKVPTTTRSSDGKGKGKAQLKPGPPPDKAREAAQALGDQVQENAAQIAKQYGKTTRDILTLAGLHVKASRAANPANKHAEWFAHHFPKGSEVSSKEYNEASRADYKQRIKDLPEGDDREAALKAILDWCEIDEARQYNGSASLKSIVARMNSAKDRFSSLAQSFSRLEDIEIVGALIYTGTDPAGKQLSSLFAGSDLVRHIIEDNSANVREILDRLTTAVKTPSLISLGLKLPTFETPNLLAQRPGEPVRDRDRRALVMIFKEEIGRHVDISTLPWKDWLRFAIKHKLCLMGWRDDVICPGRDFSLKKIPANDLREMVQAYVDGDRTRNTTFTVEKWTEEQLALSPKDPERGKIPLIVSVSKTLRIVRDAGSSGISQREATMDDGYYETGDQGEFANNEDSATPSEDDPAAIYSDDGSVRAHRGRASLRGIRHNHLAHDISGYPLVSTAARSNPTAVTFRGNTSSDLGSQRHVHNQSKPIRHSNTRNTAIRAPVPSPLPRQSAQASGKRAASSGNLYPAITRKSTHTHGDRTRSSSRSWYQQTDPSSGPMTSGYKGYKRERDSPEVDHIYEAQRGATAKRRLGHRPNSGAQDSRDTIQIDMQNFRFSDDDYNYPRTSRPSNVVQPSADYNLTRRSSRSEHPSRLLGPSRPTIQQSPSTVSRTLLPSRMNMRSFPNNSRHFQQNSEAGPSRHGDHLTSVDEDVEMGNADNIDSEFGYESDDFF